MNKKHLQIVISAVFGAVLAVVIVAYILLHRNADAEKNIYYAGFTGGAGSGEFQNYWDTDWYYDLAAVDEGYYYMNSGSNMLLFFNLETNDVIPVCAKPECSHDSAECNAFFGNKTALQSIYYYRDYIYYFGLSDGMAMLCRMDKSGTARETVAELMPNSGVDSIKAVFQGDYAYVHDGGELLSEQETTESLIEVSLSTGQKKTVYEVTGTGISITNVKCFDGKIYITVREADSSISVDEMHVHSKGLFSYSHDTDAVETVSGENINDYYIVDDTFYYFVTGEGLYKAASGSDTPLKIWDSTDKCDMCSVSSDGEYIYLNNHKYCYYMWELYGFSENRYLVLDKDGGLVNEIMCPDALALYFGDDRYLFYMNMNEMDGLMYMDKKNIETETVWKKVFGSEEASDSNTGEGSKTDNAADKKNYKNETGAKLSITYPVLHKGFADETLMGGYKVNVVNIGTALGEKDEGGYIAANVIGWPSLYDDDNIGSLEFTAYNASCTFDIVSASSTKYTKRNQEVKGETKRVNGSNDESLSLVILNEFPSSDSAAYNYMQPSSVEIGKAIDVINNVLVEVKVNYTDGTEQTDYYRLESASRYNIYNIKIYKLDE